MHGGAYVYGTKKRINIMECFLLSFRIPKEITIRAMALNCGMYDLKTLAQELYDETEWYPTSLWLFHKVSKNL